MPVFFDSGSYFGFSGGNALYHAVAVNRCNRRAFGTPRNFPRDFRVGRAEPEFRLLPLSRKYFGLGEDRRNRLELILLNVHPAKSFYARRSAFTHDGKAAIGVHSDGAVVRNFRRFHVARSVEAFVQKNDVYFAGRILLNIKLNAFVRGVLWQNFRLQTEYVLNSRQNVLRFRKRQFFHRHVRLGGNDVPHEVQT